MLNTVTLIGRLAADPELKYTPTGTAVCALRLGVERDFKTQSGEKQTDWFDVTAWKHNAEFAANYLDKGRLVCVHGRLEVRSWVQQDGQKRSKVEVIANNIYGLDRPKDGARREPPADSPPAAGTSSDSEYDYDPFAEE